MDVKLPPGPRLPRIVQTLGFMLGGTRYLERCRRRYGGAVTMSTLFDGPFVMVFDPSLVKQVFQGSNEQLHAGEANALLGPLLGQRSILVLDGGEHLRHRRLMLPPFHGRRMQRYEQAMIAATDGEIGGAWPVEGPFPVLPSMQSLTLQVVMRAVFGFDPGPAEDELRTRLRAMIEPITRRRRGMLMFALTQGRVGGDSGAEGFTARRRAVDEVLFAEIARRRHDPDLAEREDVFSALLVAEDEDGGRLSDQEVRDELVTLLVAGHETTATGLAWTIDLILHAPRVLARAREAVAAGDDAYLDALVKESLRLRPIIPAVGRVVRGEPFALGPWMIPPGVEINPSIRTIQRRPDLYPQPSEFRPERFLGPDAPDTYTWVPFGGGTRRCLGASFALMEMRVVLRRILERCDLAAAAEELDKVQFRAITLAPRHGVRVLQRRPPASSGHERSDAHDGARVALGHVGEHLEHRFRRRAHPRSPHGGGDDLAGRAARRELADHGVAALAGERELGDERDADAGGDESLHGLVVVALEGDLGLEPGDQARAHHVARTGARGRGLNPLLVAEVLEGEVLLGDERMGGGQDHVHGVLEQGHRAQRRSRPLDDAGELEEKREIDLPGPEPGGDLLGLALGEGERDVGMTGAEGGDRLGHEGGARRGERGHAQAAAPHAHHRGELLLGGVDLGEDRPRLLDQGRPRRRGPHAAAIANDERRPHLGLEASDGLGDGRLRVGQRLGRGRERSPLDDLTENSKTAQIQHQPC
ncbi:MAG TPA: cytochrome P450 [Solirubrobacteraceae bacterium]|nr:cytochrome P450 [Solirubrobacteraceae bacterium]